MPRPNPQEEHALTPYVANEGQVNESHGFDNTRTYYRVYGSVSTPGFHGMKRKYLPDNPTSSSIVIRSVGNSRAVYETRYVNVDGPYWVPTATYGSWEHLNYYPTDPESVPIDIRNKAVMRLCKEVGDISVNVAQAFAERRQTIDLIASTAVRVAEAASALKAGRLGDVFAALKQPYNSKFAKLYFKSGKTGQDALASHWLQLQYGWKPLLQDLHGSMEALANRIKSRPWHAIVSASASGSVSESVFKNPGYSQPLVPMGSVSKKFRTKLKVKYSCESGLVAASQTLGLTNPALLAWELLPYSFVVDWFLPVGNYLGALTAYNGLVFHGGTEVNLSVIEFSTSYSYGYTLFNQDRISGYGSGSSRLVRFSRDALTAFPVPSFPSLKSPVSYIHSANALALLQNVFGRKK